MAAQSASGFSGGGFSRYAPWRPECCTAVPGFESLADIATCCLDEDSLQTFLLTKVFGVVGVVGVSGKES